MHFFGLIGTITFLIGAATSLWLIIEKITAQAKGLQYRAVTISPFYVSLVALIIGMQLFLSGFIGEMISGTAVKGIAIKSGKGSADLLLIPFWL